MNRPFLPTDLPQPDPLAEWRKSLVVRMMHDAGAFTHERAAEHLWPGDQPTRDLVLRSVQRPASLTGWGSQFAARGVNPFLQSLRPTSAAARLFDAANSVSMKGRSTVMLSRRSASFPIATFTGEGEPIPVVQGALDGVLLGPPAKLPMIAALSGDLVAYSADTAEEVIRLGLEEGVSRGLDAAVFSSAAGSDIRPAGLFNGVTPIAATSGGGLSAVTADLKNLVGAVADAGGGGNVAIYASPRQAVALSIYAPNLIYPVVPAPVLPNGTVAAIEQGAIASGFDTVPDVTFSRSATVHYENATPAHLATGGTPAGGQIASAFQTDVTLMRVIQPCAWATTGAGMVQFITGATW